MHGWRQSVRRQLHVSADSLRKEEGTARITTATSRFRYQPHGILRLHARIFLEGARYAHEGGYQHAERSCQRFQIALDAERLTAMDVDLVTVKWYATPKSEVPTWSEREYIFKYYMLSGGKREDYEYCTNTIVHEADRSWTRVEQARRYLSRQAVRGRFQRRVRGSLFRY